MIETLQAFLDHLQGSGAIQALAPVAVLLLVAAALAARGWRS